MSRITILSTVNTKSSKLKALDWIRRNLPDAIFLDFPACQESFFREIARGYPELHSREVAAEILIYTARAKIRKVKAEEWKELIGEVHRCKSPGRKHLH